MAGTDRVGLVIAAVGRLAELEGQDHELVTGMSQAVDTK